MSESAYRWAEEHPDLDSLAKRLPEGFVKQYLREGLDRTDAPFLYHWGAVLTVLATVSPVTLKLDAVVGGSLNPNLFVLLVGRQGERKSTAAKIASELISVATPERLIPEPASAVALIESIAECPDFKGLLMVEEMLDLLVRTGTRSGGNHATEIKTTLLKAWDGHDLSRMRAYSARQRHLQCKNPRMSLLAAGNPPGIEEHSDPGDFTGGFYSRFLIFYAGRSRYQSAQRLNTKRWDRLMQWCRDRAQQDPNSYGTCLGLTDGARALWRLFAYGVDKSIEYLPDERYAGIHSRAPVMALKIAMLLEFGCDAGIDGEPWWITEEIMEIAIDLAMRAIQSTVALFQGVKGSREMRERHRVVQAMVVTEWMRIGEITDRAKLLIDRAELVLKTLVAEGYVAERREPKPGGKPGETQRVYMLLQEEADIAVMPVQVKAAVDRAMDEARSWDFGDEQGFQGYGALDINAEPVWDIGGQPLPRRTWGDPPGPGQVDIDFGAYQRQWKRPKGKKAPAEPAEQVEQVEQVEEL